MRTFGWVLVLGFLSSAVAAAPSEPALGKPDIVVAADGSGATTSVQAAIDRVPDGNRRRFVIQIKPGIYREQIRIPANKPFISLVGTSAANTVLTFGLSNKEAGTTSAAYAIYIGGADFQRTDITFENSFGRPAGPNQQAVAIVAEADRLVFRHCRFLGWQDTLYAKGGRQYYQDCYIEGSVDFIFGQAAAVFSGCEIHSKTAGYIAAPMRFAADERSGYVFYKCRLTAADDPTIAVFLGRPWRAYGRAVFIETEMGGHIRPAGWDNWGSAANETTAYFAEYRSTGPGATPDQRVKWMHRLDANTVKPFLPQNFLRWSDGWDPDRVNDGWLGQHPPIWKLVSWREVFDQAPLWYATDEAARIADQVVLYQKVNGGWEKNSDFSLILRQKEKAELLARATDVSETTIDNRTTYTQIAYLAKVTTASLTKSAPPTNFQKHKDAFYRGLDYLLAMQYANGGFPQFFPLRAGYYSHITYNDDAMIGALTLLDDIARRKPDYLFVDEDHRVRAATAVQKGVEAILKTQVTVDGRLTVWCAQHDEVTLLPALARTYELISLSGYESVGVVRFLMSIDDPSPAIRAAIEGAIQWFQAAKLTGIRVVEKPDPHQPRGYDRVVIKDRNAPPLWARFYQIGTNKPIFSGRDGVIKDSLAEIEAERRNGYRWYVTEPKELIEKDYPKWKAKLGERID